MVGKTIIMQSILVLMLTITIFGREIGEFTNFRITYNGEKTGYLLKNNDNDDYVLNLKPSENLAPMNIGHVLLNTNDEKRSGYTLLRCGQRGSYSNWGSSDYVYALRLSRQNWWDSPAYITGSWSPDTR